MWYGALPLQARPRLEKSEVVDSDTGAGKADEVRTSSGAFFAVGETPVRTHSLRRMHSAGLIKSACVLSRSLLPAPHGLQRYVRCSSDRVSQWELVPPWGAFHMRLASATGVRNCQSMQVVLAAPEVAFATVAQQTSTCVATLWFCTASLRR